MTNRPEPLATKIDAIVNDEQVLHRTFSQDAMKRLVDDIASVKPADQAAVLAALRAKDGDSSLVIASCGTLTLDWQKLPEQEAAFLKSHDHKLGAAVPALASTIEAGNLGRGQARDRIKADFLEASRVLPGEGQGALSHLINAKLKADHSPYLVFGYNSAIDLVTYTKPNAKLQDKIIVQQ
jgi:hypothetical protein